LELRKYMEETWEERRLATDPCKEDYSDDDDSLDDEDYEIANLEDFDKLIIIQDRPPLEELVHLSLDKLAEMYRDVPIRTVNGNARTEQLRKLGKRLICWGKSTR